MSEPRQLRIVWNGFRLTQGDRVGEGDWWYDDDRMVFARSVREGDTLLAECPNWTERQIDFATLFRECKGCRTPVPMRGLDCRPCRIRGLEEDIADKKSHIAAHQKELETLIETLDALVKAEQEDA